MPTRRDFLISAAASTLPGIISSGVAGLAPAATAANLREDTWDQGRLALMAVPDKKPRSRGRPGLVSPGRCCLLLSSSS